MHKFFVVLLEKEDTNTKHIYLRMRASSKKKIETMFTEQYHIIEIERV